jgi:amino-acid N-acetyltransferase
MEKEPLSQIDYIREAFHYRSRFDGATMVFKIDFPVTETAGFAYVMKDIALLAKTGLRIVIVPGSKEWIDTVLLDHHIVSTFAGNDRITQAAAIPFVEMAAFHVATRFITALSASRVDAVIGNFVRARGLGVVDGVDTEHSGAVDKIFSQALTRVLDMGMVPILPCIGWSPVGKPYNVPSNDIALSVSGALGALKLFIISAEDKLRPFALPPHVSRDEHGRIVRLLPAEAAEILDLNKAAFPQGCQELSLALRASKAGVERVHIINGREEGAVLKELFSNLGSGTMVYADEYESIRPIRNSDIPDILRIMEPLMNAGILLRRLPEDIQSKKDDYVVFEIDGSVHACGALHDWGENQAEIAAIAADRAYADMGLGSRIVRFLIERAKKHGYSRVFVLTTTARDWFESLGFKEAALETLPPKKRKLYNYARMSKIFALEL